MPRQNHASDATIKYIFTWSTHRWVTWTSHGVTCRCDSSLRRWWHNPDLPPSGLVCGSSASLSRRLTRFLHHKTRDSRMLTELCSGTSMDREHQFYPALKITASVSNIQQRFSRGKLIHKRAPHSPSGATLTRGRHIQQRAQHSKDSATFSGYDPVFIMPLQIVFQKT